MKRVLFIDDDPALLSSMERLFESRYDVVTAGSAVEANELLTGGQTFEVIVTDQRMPGQTGLEFVNTLREQGHGSRFILLTGTGDIEVATEAVNTGVFRLLHKPAGVDDLDQAINAGFSDFEQDAARDRLLKKTFIGAVSAITTMMEDSLPEFSGLALRVSSMVELLCDHLQMPCRWEYKVAARLSLAGFASIPNTPDESHWRGHDAVATQVNDFGPATRKAAKLLSAIPRLDLPAEMLGAFPDADGSLCSLKPKTPAAIASVGACLVRVGLLAEMLLHHGVEPSDAAGELLELLPEVHPSLPEAVATRVKPIEGLEIKQIHAGEVAAGMVTAGAVLHRDGGVLIRARKRITESQADNLRNASENGSIDKHFAVNGNSFAAFRRAISTPALV